MVIPHIEEIRQWYQRGDFTRVAERTGVTSAAVTQAVKRGSASPLLCARLREFYHETIIPRMRDSIPNQ